MLLRSGEANVGYMGRGRSWFSRVYKISARSSAGIRLHLVAHSTRSSACVGSRLSSLHLIRRRGRLVALTMGMKAKNAMKRGSFAILTFDLFIISPWTRNRIKTGAGPIDEIIHPQGQVACEPSVNSRLTN